MTYNQEWLNLKLHNPRYNLYTTEYTDRETILFPDQFLNVIFYELYVASIKELLKNLKSNAVIIHFTYSSSFGMLHVKLNYCTQ